MDEESESTDSAKCPRCRKAISYATAEVDSGERGRVKYEHTDLTACELTYALSGLLG